MKQKNRNRLAIGVIFSLMLLAAVIESMRGILVPSFKSLIGMSNSMVATMLTLGSVGYVSGTYMAAGIRSRWGNKSLLLIALGLLMLSALCLAYTVNYPMYLIGMLLMNIGLGLNSVGANLLIPMLIISMQVLVMNSLHFMYGFGAMLGQRVSGYLIVRGIGPKQLYLGLLAIYALVLVFLVFSRFPDEEASRDNSRPLRSFLRDPIYLLYIFGLSSYVFGEQGLAIWLTDYLKVVFEIDENQASQILSLFFILLGVGRLAGGLIVERLGRFRSVLLGMGLGWICVTAGLVSGTRALYLISLAGLFYSIVFPTMMVTIGQHYPRVRAQAMSLILTGTSALGIIYNQFYGLLVDRIGYQKSVFLIPLATLLGMFFLWNLSRQSLKDH